MRGSVQSLDLWLDPNHNVPSRVIVDVSDWEIFVDWLAVDSNARVAPLLGGRWHVILFKDLLARHFGSDGVRTRRLRSVGVELNESKVRLDEMFVSEAIRTYFNNDAGTRPQAELLALARRAAGSGMITIISQHRGFWRIPSVSTYFIDPANLRGQDELPAHFDFLLDLGIHRQLAAEVAPLLSVSSPGQVLEAGLIALCDHVRSMSGLTLDGRDLMEQAFAPSGPRCFMNPLNDHNPRSSQQNEQKGFQGIYAGTVTALRNPLIHEGTTGHFAQTRYPDKRTLLKYLSFLSILFERADGPLP